MERAGTLVSSRWLRDHVDDSHVVIMDVRWYLPSTGRSGRAAYEAGHVPGAAFVDLDLDLSAHGVVGRGRHPLPDEIDFVRTLGRLGIGPDMHVVAYDDSGGSTAARLWWMLRRIGHARISVLDGGFPGWVAAGGGVESGPGAPARPMAYPKVEARRPGDTVERGDVLPAIAAGAVLLDARAPERFEGRAEPIDARAGHIPGAKNAPFAGNLEVGLDGIARFRTAEALRARFDALGANARVILSCGSGVTACHNALAMHVAGLPDPDVYVGSWSDWSAVEGLPVETGRLG